MQSIVRVGENGYRFALHFLDEEGSVGFLRVRIEFWLPWCAGGFEFLSSKDRIDRFVKEIGKEVVYLSDEGNLEIKSKLKSNGLLEFSILEANFFAAQTIHPLSRTSISTAATCLQNSSEVRSSQIPASNSKIMGLTTATIRSINGSGSLSRGHFKDRDPPLQFDRDQSVWHRGKLLSYWCLGCRGNPSSVTRFFSFCDQPSWPRYQVLSLSRG